MSDSSCFPYLDTKHLTKNEKSTLHRRLSKETECIITEFADLVLHMQTSLNRNQNIDPMVVVSAALLISRRKSSTRLNSQEINSINKLINHLVENNYISFFNYHIVQYIITKFGEDADKRALNDYETKFKEFCQKNVFEIPQDVLGPVPRNEEKLAFKVTQALELIDHLPLRHKSGGDNSAPSSPTLTLSLDDVLLTDNS